MSFKSNRSAFNKVHNSLKDMFMGHMAMDIEVHLKTDAGMPVSNTIASGNKRGGGGHMKSETRHFKGPNGGYRVEVDKAYAAYQERGAREDGSHQVLNYSTPGTGKGFFERAIKWVTPNIATYISEVRSALGI